MAIGKGIATQRDHNIFQMYNPAEKTNISVQPILEPDDDLHRAITMDELLEGVLEDIHKFYANK